MALLWCDGFESYGASGNYTDPTDIMAQKYVFESESYTPNIVTGRDGGSSLALRLQGGQAVRMRTPDLTTNRVLIVGMAFMINTANIGSPCTLLSFRHPDGDGQTGGTYQCLDLEIYTSNELRLILGATTLNTTSGLNLSVNTWYDLECKIYCANSGGTYEVKIDGNSVMSGTTDTQFDSAYDYYCKVGLKIPPGGSGIDWSLDDFYVLDGSGTTCNDFLGPGYRVRDLRPNADASGNWTEVGAGSAYSCMNDTTQNLSTRLYATSSGQQEIMEYSQTLNSGDVIAGAMLSTFGTSQMGCALGVRAVAQQGTGTVNSGDVHGFLEDNGDDNYSGSCVTEVYQYDPDGNSWNATLLGGARFGVEAV